MSYYRTKEEGIIDRMGDRFREYDFSSRNIKTGYCETFSLFGVLAENRWDTQMNPTQMKEAE